MHADAAVYPGPQRIAWGICAAVVVALVASSFGTTEPSPERANVTALPKPLLSPEAARVSRVLSKEGDEVVAGQVLVELTAPHAAAKVRKQLGAAAAEERITTALIAALESGRPPVLSRESPAPERAQFQAEWRGITLQLAQFDAAQAKWQAELAALQQTIAHTEALLPPAEERARDFERLVDDDAVSAELRRVRVQERIQQEQKLSALHAQLKSVQAALSRHENDRAELASRALHHLSERQAAAAERRSQLTRGLGNTEQATRLIQLTAPMAGTVQQLMGPAEGGLASPGEVLMVIAPKAGGVELMPAAER